jgi:hypothetical protein
MCKWPAENSDGHSVKSYFLLTVGFLLAGEIWGWKRKVGSARRAGEGVCREGRRLKTHWFDEKIFPEWKSE